MIVYAEHGAYVTEPREDSQIAVVGGGLVGMSLAVALGRAGISVSLIEASNAQPRSDSAYDSRPIALSQCSRRILDTLGVWDALGAAATPITRIHVSDRGHFGFARMCAEDHDVDALGYVASAAALGQALEEVLASMHEVCVLRPAVVDQVERE
ncbi:MAG: 2-octaprenyl-6-methoxyphenyl hydroxylase, partial [Lysobacterales bacterium]